ncbi:methyl-accepting chemotaxis protein [Faecalispora anaeroviscerum]|uniref:methyl-accepting chemotaxis protein n=1 Tax=Faecalispora anaeroviscerum TaxID=2991836 RepID=UPI0024B95847|nr:methyl-accepting chemotaxis protein [Faecalispora anaeroviscerum]
MKSLKSKLHLFIMILVLFTNVLATGVTCWLSYRNSMTQAEQTSSYLAESYKQFLGSEMNKYRKEAEAVAKSAVLSSADAAARQQYLQEQAKQDGFVYFALADSQGNTQQDGNVSQEKWFQSAKSGTAYIGDPVKSRRGDDLTLTIGAPVSGGQVIYGEITYDAFAKMQENIKISDEGYAFVISQDSKTVLHPSKDTVANPVNYAEKAKTDKSVQPVAELYSRAISGETGIEYTIYQGEKRQVGFTQISGPEKWAIAVSRPISQIMQDLYRTLLINVGVAVLIQLLTLVASGMFAARLAKPIEDATERIELLAKGDLQTDVPQVKSRDEIARLSTALGHTVQELRLYIQDISYVLDAVSRNNLTVESGVQYRGDFAPIRESLTRILESLNETFEGISQAAYQVNAGAEEMALGAQNLAQNSAEQASTVESLNTSLQNVSEHVKNNASHATSVEGLSNETIRFVQQGNEQMNQMLQSMRDIDHAANEISDIIKVIDDIAAQTNILALNAAVEAARAGSAGKGFAVVADEVRSLASKSAQATTTTSDLIQKAIDSVKKGMVIADQTAESLDQMVEKSGQVNELINRIAEASNEQAKAITELDNGMLQISSVTQTNSATAEESAAASEELSSQSEMLKELMQRFQTKGSAATQHPQSGDE